MKVGLFGAGGGERQKPATVRRTRRILPVCQEKIHPKVMLKKQKQKKLKKASRREISSINRFFLYAKLSKGYLLVECSNGLGRCGKGKQKYDHSPLVSPLEVTASNPDFCALEISWI